MVEDNPNPGARTRLCSVREVSLTPKRASSSDLLKGSRELVIEHAGEEYRLRLTSKGKLILTK